MKPFIISIMLTLLVGLVSAQDSVSVASPKPECENPQYGGWVPKSKAEEVAFALNGQIVRTEQVLVIRDVTCPARTISDSTVSPSKKSK